MKKQIILKSLEEIKVISDPFRTKILFLFDDAMEPLTVKQMAVKLEEVPSKVHYHVKELERIGVLEIVETKEKAGILEKYYLPTAETFKIERSIGTQEYESEHLKIGENVFKTMQEDFFYSSRNRKPEDKTDLKYGFYHMTDEETKELETIIMEYLEDKKPREGTKAYRFGYVLFRKYDNKE